MWWTNLDVVAYNRRLDEHAQRGVVEEALLQQARRVEERRVLVALQPLLQLVLDLLAYKFTLINN